MKFFVNPGRKRRKKAKASSRRRRATAPRGRGGRFVRRKRKALTVARKRKTRKRSTARRTTARRRIRRRRAVAVAAPRRRRRRSYAANPRRVVRRRRRRAYRSNPGIVSTLKQGLVDALFVTGGKAANNMVARAIPALPLPGMAGDLVKSLGVATLVSIGARRFLKGDRARMVSAGAFQALVEGFIKGLNVPVVSSALGEYDILANNYNGLGSYARPQLPASSGISAYPNPEFEGEQFAYDQAG